MAEKANSAALPDILVVGIAGKDNDHLSILANIAATMDECSEAELEKLYNTKDPKVLYERFAAAN